jgi:hypothetical protein
MSDNPADTIFNSLKPLNNLAGKIPEIKVNLEEYNKMLSESAKQRKQFIFSDHFVAAGTLFQAKNFGKKTIYITSIAVEWFNADYTQFPTFGIYNSAGNFREIIWRSCTCNTVYGGGDCDVGNTAGNDHIYFNPPLQFNLEMNEDLAAEIDTTLTGIRTAPEITFFIYGFETD